ncbi:MAG TPA: hypothetical protein PLB91_14060 [Spirochaetales bacterium]|nr:hypothetical protein [Spirochaetales bacterium]HRY53891.1 hypothetical protein [Spirochaetia bacterium]HRZ66029.1 hypothetical protein [Spirochaetia bacterium]
MKRFTAPILVAALAGSLALSGCQELFTTSLAEPLARDEVPVPDSLSKDQAAEYAALVAANRDTELAQALMPAMAELVADNPGDAGVLGDAVTTAGIATGLEDAFMDAIDAIDIDTLIDDPDSVDPATFAGLLAGVSVDADAAAVFAALATADAAELDEAGVNAANYVVAAVALVIADVESQAGDLENLLDTDFSGYTAGPEATLAIDIINAAAAQWPDDDLISAMQSLFDIL